MVISESGYDAGLGKELRFDAFSIVQATFYNRQMQLNRFDMPPTDVVKRLTGREPEDFETITRQYFNKSPYRVRSVSNWLTAMKKFMLMPFAPVPDANEREALNTSPVAILPAEQVTAVSRQFV